MATRLEALDELIALASNAGMLGNEAITANALAYGKRDRRLSARARAAARKATAAEQQLAAARSRFLTNTGAWQWSAEIAPGKPPVEVPATPQDRKLAIDVARQALHAVRNPTEDGPGGHPWAYFAEETRSWWGVTTAAMIQLADMLASSGYTPALVIEQWAEADQTAVELDRALSRRLSKEHGR